MAQLKYLSLMVLSVVANSALAGNNPWTMEEQTYALSFSQVVETYDEAWIRGSSTKAKFGDDVEHNTSWLTFDYGLSDQMLLTLTTGYTNSECDCMVEEFSGRSDTSIALQYQFLDAFVDQSVATMAVRVGAIIKGDYDRSYKDNPHSPGDRASGLEGSLIIGRYLTNRLVITGEGGYRKRYDNTPDDVFVNSSLIYAFNNTVEGAIGWQRVIGDEGTDIKEPGSGFKPSEFHKTREISEHLEASLNFSFVNYNIAFGYANALGGSNTPDNQVVFLSFSGAFGY